MGHQPMVLVVDDDENIISAFRTFLKKEHCSMIAAGSAEEAMTKLGNRHVDLVVTDIRLKRESGITLLLKLKATHPRIPVIVITGYPDLVSEKEVKAYGADYFFLKPIDLEQLRQAVRKCLDLREPPQQKNSVKRKLDFEMTLRRKDV